MSDVLNILCLRHRFAVCYIQHANLFLKIEHSAIFLPIWQGFVGWNGLCCVNKSYICQLAVCLSSYLA